MPMRKNLKSAKIDKVLPRRGILSPRNLEFGSAQGKFAADRNLIDYCGTADARDAC